ncbi:cyclin-B2-1-like [Octopus sinensis]|uniref:Cyclin-B2-1-like n=1 Tax=Octopus sinensis TaxID=2607531 RepID=A0A6P7S9D1_9MOLL|nr:cyclin-B2-1-like [Octopus sinensis]
MDFSDVVRNLRNVYEHERRQKKVRNYFRDGHHNFQPEDRKVVVNWMISCVDYYYGLMDILHLSVTLFDLFLSSEKSPLFSREKLQCVGAICIKIAFDTIYNAKTDEGFAIVAMTSRVDPESSIDELRRIYILVINRFRGKTFFVTPYVFLSYYHIILKLEPHHDLYSMTNYVLELALYDDFLSVKCYYKPSLVAATALYTGIIALGFHTRWFDDLSVLTGYNGEEIDINDVHERMKFLLKTAYLEPKIHSTQARYYLQENNYMSTFDYSHLRYHGN